MTTTEFEIKENKHKKSSGKILSFAKSMKRSNPLFPRYFGGGGKGHSGGHPLKVSLKLRVKLAEEIIGLKEGPDFFTECNYQGHKTNQDTSVKKFTAADAGEPAQYLGSIASVQIPAGWCVKLYSKPYFKGQVLELCGKKNYWCLSEYALKVKFPVDLGAPNPPVVVKYITKKTTW